MASSFREFHVVEAGSPPPLHETVRQSEEQTETGNHRRDGFLGRVSRFWGNCTFSTTSTVSIVSTTRITITISIITTFGTLTIAIAIIICHITRTVPALWPRITSTIRICCTIHTCSRKHYKPSSEQAFLVFLHARNIYEFRHHFLDSHIQKFFYYSGTIAIYFYKLKEPPKTWYHR